MYIYNDFDRQFIRERARQYRHQWQRHQAGQLSDAEFRPLRLQNGWYIQRHAPMLRVAVPYGVMSAQQARVLADVADRFDRGFAHLTTRQNLQFNWIALEHSADVMDLLAQADLHGIQTSGNCIRNITTDAMAGIAADEVADPRPFCELLRQWSTLHPEFAHLPRKFKIAVTGSREDRAALAWHDVGLQLTHSSAGELGFRVLVGGGMGRTPVIARVLRDFLPWPHLLSYIEAVVRVYNQWGRRDNAYKARIKILVRAEGDRFANEVEREFDAIVTADGAAHTITQAELDRVSQHFALPSGGREPHAVGERGGHFGGQQFNKWRQRQVRAQRQAGLNAVVLSLKRVGQAPGDLPSAQLRGVADLAERYSGGELRLTHEQNILLPNVHGDRLFHLWQDARALGLAHPNTGLLSDVIACPGGDFCALANARTLPLARAITEAYQDLDELEDLGEIDLHISGCMNSCGHHHSAHIGILGVDRDGREVYQVSLGGSDGSALSGAATPGRIVGPAFEADDIVPVIQSLLEIYCARRLPAAAPGQRAETFIATLRRVGLEPFRQAADRVREAALA